MTNEFKPDSLPTAIPRENRGSRISRLWLLTPIAILVCIGLFAWSSRLSGRLIAIEFEQGHGLKVDDSLRYRGIEIGRVEQISLKPNANGIVVHVRLFPNSQQVVSDGSQFWIVRPNVSLESVRGIDTIVGPKYLAIEPGTPSSNWPNRFRGAEVPPNLVPADGSIEILLDANTRHGLLPGAPVLHRGFQIGDVLHVGLSSDARSVNLRCAIYSDYRELVRTNTKFWVRSGWRLDMGITGVQIDADSLSQIVSGGIEIATPDASGDAVGNGHHFALADRAEAEWLTWKPSIPYGPVWGQRKTKAPQPYRFVLRWKEKQFGFTRDKQRFGWCLIDEEGFLLASKSRITPPDSAIAKSAIIEVNGLSIPAYEESTRSLLLLSSGDHFVRAAKLPSIRNDVRTLSRSNLVCQPNSNPMDVLILSPDLAQSVPIDASRLKPLNQAWTIDEEVGLNKEMDGCPVLASDSGQVIGLLEANGKQNRIQLFLDLPQQP